MNKDEVFYSLEVGDIFFVLEDMNSYRDKEIYLSEDQMNHIIDMVCDAIDWYAVIEDAIEDAI